MDSRRWKMGNSFKIAALFLFLVLIFFVMLFLPFEQAEKQFLGINTSDIVEIVPTVVPTATEHSNFNRMETAYTIKINFVENGISQPVRGAEISLITPSTQLEQAHKKTDDSGSITVHLSKLSDIVLSATHEDFFPLINIPLIANQENVIHLVMHKKYAIKGNVVNPQLLPLERATLSLQTQTEDRVQTNRYAAISNASGEFHFYPIYFGDYIIEASHPDYLQYSGTCSAGKQSYEIVLRNDVQLTVRTIDEYRQLISDAEVKLTYADPSSGLFVASKHTNAQGIAHFNFLKPNRYEIAGNAPFSSEPARNVINLTTKSEYDLTLMFKPNPFSVSGRVLDSRTFEGISSATVICQSVEASSDLFSSTFSITDQSGRYKFEQLPVGKYRFHVDRIKGYISGDYDKFDFYGAKFRGYEKKNICESYVDCSF